MEALYSICYDPARPAVQPTNQGLEPGSAASATTNATEPDGVEDSAEGIA
jgi:hypothetical protein